jgi:hypothetical protein
VKSTSTGSGGGGGGGGVGAGGGGGGGGVGVGAGGGAGGGGGACGAACVTGKRVPAAITNPERAAPVFGPTVTTTVAVPRPDAGETDAHELSLATVHAHASCALMRTSSVPPLGGTGVCGAETSNRHGAACCDTSMRPSPIAIAPARVSGSGLLSTRKPIVPSPCPLDPDVITTHGDADAAVHEHSRETLTATLPVPPEAANERAA